MTLFASLSAGTVEAFNEAVPAVFGRAGTIAADAKREGDGASPIGAWPVRAALLRPDRMAAPATALPWRWLRADDGWSDDAADPAYNRPVRHPHRFGAERLWRDDGAYDIIIVLGHNDRPPLAPLGSAIFFHCTRPDRRPTQGCVAVDRPVLARWLDRLQPGDRLVIAP
ncbi:L,D-transpeptidase family protein [Polymorphobacter fuscus]|uniref:L,D-transpeptidase family protein n=1 Tax=Sandarakinorhabdus fusca TaxID=1439888 RepID=A0A7C9KY94_9SPHN|nr:L,D-transpeptidase family protein [Polymorphobacter fuscus]MQT18202.1 L,D-transpeptidase family protein [Polymorphobacter fuscus]NJC09522.1 L,D-peptidoglycan transpeptidase YkuD (ErfK/YbiS/YcfS/YnhG family) [Polymorphobacter fuscus]